jgi:hypothetical protein
MNSVKNQISRRDGLKLGLAGLTVSPWGAPFYARAATEEKMTIAKVEVDRFSITCSKPFESVVAALKSAVGQPDIVEFFQGDERCEVIPGFGARCAERRWSYRSYYALRGIRAGRRSAPRNWTRDSQDHSFLGGQSTHYERNGQARSRCWLLRTGHSPYRWNVPTACTSPMTKWRVTCFRTATRTLLPSPEILMQKLQPCYANARAEIGQKFSARLSLR